MSTKAFFSKKMFLDSDIPKLFTCVKDKNSSLVSIGCAPYFNDELTNAYNRVTKKEQQDLAI